VLTLPSLEPGETIVICSGNVPNRKGQPIVNDWVGVLFEDSQRPELIEFGDLIDYTRIDRSDMPNPVAPVDLEATREHVPEAVYLSRQWMEARRDEVNDRLNEKLERQRKRLKRLESRHKRQVELKFAETERPEAIVSGEKEREKSKIEKIFGDFFDWIESTMTIEERAYIQVVAVLTGTDH
jgi:hypothetical protein